MSFKEVKAEDLMLNPFTKIGKEWMLITAGNQEKINTMTASWGGLGIMWGENAATIYIRPQRYTKEFVDSNDRFTMSFFNNDYKKALTLCGTVSGRDADKIKDAGLTPFFQDGSPAFEEADMIMVCEKMYHQVMQPELFDNKAMDAKWFPNKDYHTLYIAKVLKVLVRV